MLRDLRLAWRLFIKNPGFTAIVVTTLALGIGLNTAVFSAVDALLLRPLPGVRAPERVVQLYRSWPGGMDYGSNSVPHYQSIRERTQDVFTDVAAWDFEGFSITIAGRPQRAFGQMVSANFFSLLGVEPIKGRFFLPEEDIGRGAHPVAVLAEPTWRTMFGADPAITGKQVVLNGRNYTIVGVAPAVFRGIIPIVQPKLWVPLTQWSDVRPGNENGYESRDNNNMDVIARLKPGVTVQMARVRMTALVAELKGVYPKEYDKNGITVVLESEAGVHPMLRNTEVGLTAVVMAVVAILLLIACVNVANLFLARARDRAREMAIRLSLGARRSVLLKQLLTESLLFATVAGVASLAVAYWAITLANKIELPFDVGFAPNLQLSPTVLLFTFGASILTGLLFGIAPALQATRPSLVPALKGEAPAGRSRARASSGLVVAQMALSIVLLVCAGLFLHNLKAATNLDKGFESSNRLIASVEPELQGYDRPRTEEFYRRITERLSAMPGVISVTTAARMPLGMSNNDWGVTVPGYTALPNELMSIQNNMVASGYFTTLGIKILKGRGFETRDNETSQKVTVINQHMADHFWPGQDPLGRVVRTAGSDHTVIGVVPTGKYQRLGEDPRSYMYFSLEQHFDAGRWIQVHTAGDPSAFIPTLRAQVAAIDADMPLSDVRTIDAHLGIALLPARLTGAVLGIFGLLGLGLAAIGIYGVMAYAVAQRTREIGIRMAIGAGRGDVLRLLMRQGLTLVGTGLVIGLVLAVGAAKLASSQLYGSGGFDVMTFALVPMVLIGVAALAIWIPSRRASGLDPVVALRRE
jgi:macrolide transport system ATP-binding/permease protein